MPLKDVNVRGPGTWALACALRTFSRSNNRKRQPLDFGFASRKNLSRARPPILFMSRGVRIEGVNDRPAKFFQFPPDSTQTTRFRLRDNLGFLCGYCAPWRKRAGSRR